MIATPEMLEIRKLLSITEVSDFAATFTPKDQTIIPGQIVPTNLYLNFDGGQVPDDPVHHPTGTLPEAVSPFDTAANDDQSQRDVLIQEVLFKVSEIFAPFDVQVHRTYGAGNYGQGDGDTTIFIGAIDADQQVNVLGAGVVDYIKYANAFTPLPSSDSFAPGHLIDSDPFDVGFVDPVRRLRDGPRRAARDGVHGILAGRGRRHLDRRVGRARGRAYLWPGPRPQRRPDRSDRCGVRDGR